MGGFNLYREAKDYYDSLVPEKTEGLILISLFEKFGENAFTEDQIIDTIRLTYKDLGNTSSRTEYERNNKLIIRLQEYFLWRDEVNRVYRLKKYALEFCARIKKKLVESYSPAKIKRWFDELLNRLQEKYKLENGFEHWIEDEWEWRHNTLAEQIEVLDGQVIESVREFKEGIRNKDQNQRIMGILTSIEGKLEIIKNQAIELTKAFQSTYEIDDILTEMLELGNAHSNLANIKRVREFNQNVRFQLEQISNRIEKIKPRIREFIYDFNQRDYDRKSEKFLYYLLNKSKVTKGTQGRKDLRLPNEIPDKCISNSCLSPRFTIIPIKEIGPKRITTPKKRKIDFSKRQELLDKTKAWKFEKERVSFWTKEAQNIIQIQGSLEFTDLFFEILRSPKDNLSIAVKTAHRLVRRYIKSEQLKVQVTQIRQNDRMVNNVSIWKMSMEKI